MTQILTIGHSNLDILAFLEILRAHGVQALVDIRSDPYSRYAPQFNKNDFQHNVTNAGLEYRYSGSSIGGKPKDPALQTSAGITDYDKLAAAQSFQDELKAIVELAKSKCVVLMCSEGDPMSCHRERIIAQVLRSWGVEVRHIQPDGTIQAVAQQGLF
ncbi:MAG: DUF488 domain-containing protein [Armatimonadetes bacterium]|nr:DUF488 domain-containing protein [Armatimonadota bacterium]